MAELPKRKNVCLMIVNEVLIKDYSQEKEEPTPSEAPFSPPPPTHHDRMSAAMDLKATLEKHCACRVEMRRNLTVKEMKIAVDVFVNEITANAGDIDNVWLVLSSHGDWEMFLKRDGSPWYQADVICGTDDTLPVFSLTKPLVKTGKPCVIVVQAGRGNEIAEIKLDKEEGCITPGEETTTICGSEGMRKRCENTWPELDAHFNNQILLYSSLPGKAASDGRPLLPALKEVLETVDLCTTDVESLFAKTCQKVKDNDGEKQEFLHDHLVTPVYYNKLWFKIHLQ
ncbi:hypothetical protein CAPTEDRAFT_187490 [Capitella teleta]|uniref:Caspase family p20 domain-containing protein n=1 Tax=Capitella teleta TaxID=283909 RepID=R7TUL0_CAPTE|nr:hypothetical protein CAPTEDRAFT_187490 [Capitella teleta]|eukprot:ELT95161.1 hypothetical protein CAPTEDRAFT_187490 [Capitella teleta]